MPAKLLDGNLLSRQIRTEIATASAILSAKGTKPGLAVILIGENPASEIYVRNKVKACEEANIRSRLIRFMRSIRIRISTVFWYNCHFQHKLTVLK